MEKFNFYAANILSEDCEKTASIYSRLFSLEIVCAKKNHAELKSSAGFSIFIDKPSNECNVSPGTISFSLPVFNLDKINLAPLVLESYYKKENYASFLDEYQNRVWVFEKL
jgi:hypothetical protein